MRFQPYTLPTLLVLMLLSFDASAQYHRTLIKFDGDLSERLSAYNYTVKNERNQKVAWQTPSFLMPQLIVSMNVYNTMLPVDFGVNLPVRKNFANNYNDISRRDTVTLNRYYQFAPGAYVKFKIGKYKEPGKRYFIMYFEGNYNLNFIGKRKEMPYHYKSFDPLNNEFNIGNGTINTIDRGFWNGKINKTNDVTVNMRGGPSITVGIGREWHYDGEGFGWVVGVTRNFFDLYNKDYKLADHSKPFANWTQSPYMIEVKLIKRWDIFGE